jgi:hypothetical protein
VIASLPPGKEHLVDNRKYIGMDVHKGAIAIAVLNAAGKLVMESIIETKANRFWSS